MNKIFKIYTALHSAYGPQGWWPLSGNPRTSRCEKGKAKHTPKHHNGKPLNDDDRFEIMLGAILTQNTAWVNVEKALTELNRNGLGKHSKLITAKKNRIAALIRSAGYYNQKAERLLIISEFVKTHTIKNLIAMDDDKLRELLLGVKGIGPETADSIALYALGKPLFVVDAYTKRIFSRIGLCKRNIEYHTLQKLFMEKMKKDADTYQEYHALIVELAKKHCKTKPVCEGCPIRKLCLRKI